jgi:hypothetical protein
MSEKKDERRESNNREGEDKRKKRSRRNQNIKGYTYIPLASVGGATTF